MPYLRSCIKINKLERRRSFCHSGV